MLLAEHALEPDWGVRRVTLFKICLRWTRGDRAEAEDLLGDACLRVFEARQRGSSDAASSLSFWATVINNLGRDRLRRDRRWRFNHETSVVSPMSELPAPSASVEDQVFWREQLRAAARAVEQLSSRKRAALLMRGAGLEYAEIGGMLGIREGNARKLVEMARSDLAAEALELAAERRRVRRRAA